MAENQAPAKFGVGSSRYGGQAMFPHLRCSISLTVRAGLAAVNRL